MDNVDGATAAILIVMFIGVLFLWAWLSWVAIGMLIVYWALPSCIEMHIFLWIIANSVASAVSYHK